MPALHGANGAAAPISPETRLAALGLAAPAFAAPPPDPDTGSGWVPDTGHLVGRRGPARAGVAPGAGPGGSLDAVRAAPAGGVLHAARGALADRLPPALRRGRVQLSGAAVAGLVLIALAAVAVTLVLVLRARPHPVSLPAVPAAAPAAAPVAIRASPPSGPPLVVDVTGRVRSPGLVRLPPGSRVADALTRAGGALPGVDLSTLNLARRVVDGEQIAVGVPAAASPADAAPSSDAPLDLNGATAVQLQQLPGVGPVLAQRVVEWRAAHGAFTSVGELQQVPGFGPSKFAAVEQLVRV